MAFLDKEDFGGIIPNNIKVHSRCNFIPATRTIEILDARYNIPQNDVFAILNATIGEVLYNPFDLGKFGKLTGNTIVLDVDTTSMSNTDSIYIYLLDVQPKENENKIVGILENIETIMNNQADFFNNILT